MAKRARKRTQRKPRKEQIPRALIAGIAAAFVLIAAVLVYLASQDRQAADGVLVRVNGEPITQSELDFQYNLLPESYRAQLSREQVLEQIIDEELVMQEARRQGITVTPEDVNEEVQRILSQGGLTVQELQQNLGFFNITMDDFEGLIERQLLIRSFTQENISVPEPSDLDIEALYETTKERYSFPEQATVRHVLISSQREDAAQLGKDVYERARAGEDFCELVLNYTDDRGSRDTCGEYTFPRGFMVPEFEEASFEMPGGEFRLVQTQFGYHVIEKIASVPAGVQPLGDVRDEVVEEYESIEYSRLYAALVGALRREAQIAYAGEEPESPAEDASEQPAGDPASEPAEDAPERQVREDAASCIAQRAVLYGASWSADTRAAQEQYPTVTVVLCDETPALCAGITGYPTWKVGTETRQGRLSFEQLREATGC